MQYAQRFVTSVHNINLTDIWYLSQLDQPPIWRRKISSKRLNRNVNFPLILLAYVTLTFEKMIKCYTINNVSLYTYYMPSFKLLTSSVHEKPECLYFPKWKFAVFGDLLSRDITHTSGWHNACIYSSFDSSENGETCSINFLAFIKCCSIFMNTAP